MEEKTVLEEVKRTLNLSVIEGSFWAVMVGVGELYLPVLAIFLSATNLEIGLLASVPLFIGSLSQLITPNLVHVFGSRRKHSCFFVLIQALVWIPITLLMYLKFAENPVWLLIILATIYFSSGMLVTPAWNSWMSELVETRIRGSYFGGRNRIVGLTSFVVYTLAGIGLHYSKEYYGGPIPAFTAMFLTACMARLASTYLLSRQYEYPVDLHPPKTSIGKFIKDIRRENYGRLTLYLGLMNFSVMVASPYFVAYMFNGLRFSYLEYTAIVGIGLIIKYLSMPIAGKLCDRYGTREILKISGYLLPAIPLLWMFSGYIPYLLAVETMSAVLWAGYELASLNFMLDATEPRNRMKYIGYTNSFNGITTLAGTMTGALLLQLPAFFWSIYLTVFFVSGVLRMLVSLSLLPKLREVREIEPGVPLSRLILEKIGSRASHIGALYGIAFIRSRNDKK